MHFSHREVLRAKRIGMTKSSQLTGSDRTVRSVSENHGFIKVLRIGPFNEP